MAQMVFEFKEVFRFGWEKTKKYSRFIVLLAAVYVPLTLMNIMLVYFSGEPVRNVSVQNIVGDPVRAENLLNVLKMEGYVLPDGRVSDSVRGWSRVSQVRLPEEYGQYQQPVYDLLKASVYRLPFPRPVFWIISFGLWILGVILSIGYLSVLLAIVRDEEADISVLFTNSGLYFHYLFVTILSGVLSLAAFFLLIIPGIIVMVMLSQSAFLVIDKKLRPWAALKLSRMITRGQRWRLFLFFLLVGLINLGGLLCLGVGILVTIPLTSIALARVYDLLQASHGGRG